jgi:hypothetical protein
MKNPILLPVIVLIMLMTGCTQQARGPHHPQTCPPQNPYEMHQQTPIYSQSQGGYYRTHPYNMGHTTPPKATLPKRPKKKIKLRKVEDHNYSDTYMYPETTKAPKEVSTSNTTTSASSSMTKTECINLIGEAKFNHYTQMLGSEAASMKRCAMLKASMR